MHLVRAASLTGFSDLVAGYGGDPAALLSAAGLPADTLDPVNEDRYISHRRFEQLLQLAADSLDRPLIAVELGSRQELSMLGVLGFVMRQAPTIGAALAELQRYFHLQARGSAVVLEPAGSTVGLRFVVDESHRLASIARGAELCLSAGHAIMRTLCGTAWQPLEVRFAHKPAAPAWAYRRVFAAPVAFDALDNTLSFPAATLDVVLDAADEKLGRILHRYLDVLDSSYSDDTARVRHLIRRALASGNCSADSVAAFMGMHRRTLHRVLRAEGTTFRQLTREVREDIAIRSLRDTAIPVTLLADMLGYAEPSAFTRAFRRWTGRTPDDFRRAPEAAR